MHCGTLQLAHRALNSLVVRPVCTCAPHAQNPVVPRILFWQGAETATLFDSRKACWRGLHKEKHGPDILENQLCKNLVTGWFSINNLFSKPELSGNMLFGSVCVFNVVVSSPCWPHKHRVTAVGLPFCYLCFWQQFVEHDLTMWVPQKDLGNSRNCYCPNPWGCSPEDQGVTARGQDRSTELYPSLRLGKANLMP